jgi:OOP family OmpA-OmpF porin
MFKKTLIAAAIATLASGAYAESQQGMYMGGGVGVWAIDEDGLDESAMAARINGGYRFNEFFSVEGSYVYFAEVEDSFSQDIGGTLATADLQIDGSGWEVSLRPSYPFTESLEGYARLGWGYYDMEADVSASALGLTIDASASDTDDAFVWAVGGAWSLNDNLNLFGEYSQPDMEADVYVMTFGATYNF